MDDQVQRVLLKKAGALLNRRAYSRGELQIRLLKIADRSHVESVIDHLEQLNLLNDADYAYNFASYRIRREGWGPAKVRVSLLRRQVPQTVIEHALARVRSEGGKESILVEYINRYFCKRKKPATAQELQKLIIHLSRRGFDQETITGALKQTIAPAVMRHFEAGE